MSENPLAKTKLIKIIVNVGLKEALVDKKVLENASEQLAAITGQKPLVTKARKAIAAFKLRAGLPIGMMVTLRGERMFDFFDKLVNIVLPRIRDFQGLSPDSFDGQGNYTLGMKEQVVFPEIEYDKVEKLRGLEIVVVTSAKNDEEGRELLRSLGMPFRKN